MTGDTTDELSLFRTRAHQLGFLGVLAALALLPLFLPGYQLFALNYMAIFVMVGLGMKVLVGDAGQISLGHAGFLAIGAYATVLLNTEVGIPYLLALVLATGVTAAFGLFIGLPAVRLEGPYLAIATLGFGLAVTQIIARGSIFGGHMGLPVPTPSVGPLRLSGDVSKYYLIVGITVALCVATRNLLVTRVGRALRAIRDSEVAAGAVGVDAAWYKTLSFAVSAAYAGLAGGLLAMVTGFISPGVFTFTLSLMFLAMVVFGGLGSVTGAILGSVVMGYLTLRMDSIQDLPLLGTVVQWIAEHVMTTAGITNVGWILTGLLIVMIILVEPQGLVGLGARAARRR